MAKMTGTWVARNQRDSAERTADMASCGRHHSAASGSDSAGMRNLAGQVEALAEEVAKMAKWFGMRASQERLAEIVNSLERLRQG